MTDPKTESKETPPIPAKAGEERNLICPNCRMETPVSISGSEAEFDCSFCRTRVSATIFPRLTRESAIKKSSHLAVGGDATCQFYPELKAEVVCDECGCFMSEKASINWGGRVLCMPCLHTLREKKADTDYRANLKIWDHRALGLIALLPVTLFTAPAALFLLLRFRKEPRGWVPRSAFRWWLALILTVAILLGWTALIVVWIAMMAREMS